MCIDVKNLYRFHVDLFASPRQDGQTTTPWNHRINSVVPVIAHIFAATAKTSTPRHWTTCLCNALLRSTYGPLLVDGYVSVFYRPQA
jgi:hypothetical protein